MATIQFVFSQQSGRHYATPSVGTRFYVGAEVTYQGRHGLTNLRVADGPVYRPEDYVAEYGHWAWMLYPTAQCESLGSFHCLNTYDRAAFTFTFLQFAAHVPDGDFVRLLRALLALPEARDYFPFLELRQGRIWYVRSRQATQLESSSSTAGLMRYLNADQHEVDGQELISAARMVHWAQQSGAHRAMQVSTGIALFQEKLREHAVRFNLDGWPDYICHAICDIFHQGRARYKAVHDILGSTGNKEAIYQKLLNVGGTLYAGRIKTLKAVHKKLRDSGVFGKKYNLASGDFR